MLAAAWIVGIVAVYTAVGILFAVAFVVRGIGAVDPIAKNAGWGFRALMFSGSVALWPCLAKRWWAT